MTYQKVLISTKNESKMFHKPPSPNQRYFYNINPVTKFKKFIDCLNESVIVIILTTNFYHALISDIQHPTTTLF